MPYLEGDYWPGEAERLLGEMAAAGAGGGGGGAGAPGAGAKARKAGKVPVATVPFSVLDDGEIDLLNLDCEGSEWYVLEKMKSRPRILQVELYPKHGHHREISAWLEAHGYQVAKRWGNANLILTRAAT